jgi:hypothetical protein
MIMRRFHVLPVLLTVACLASPLSASLPDYNSVKEDAKNQGKYMLVIWTGSDWSPTSPDVVKAAETLSTTTPEGFLWCIHDEKDDVTEEEARLPRPPGHVFNIPAIEVVSPDGKLVFLQEGIKADKLPDLLKKSVKAMNQMEKAQELWKQADQAKGPAAAELLGKGLSLLPANAIAERKDIQKRIKEADPEDTKGMSQYGFDYLAFFEGLQRNLKESEKNGKKDYKAQHDAVAKELAKPGLPKLMQQQLLGADFMLYKDAGEKAEALKVLKAIEKIDPKSLMGQGAKNYYAFLTEPVILKEPTIHELTLRPDFTPTRLKLGKMYQGPGTYKITFEKAYNGGCNIRNPRFVKGNKVLAELPSDQRDKNGTEWELNIDSKDAPDLLFDCQGSGWFDQIFYHILVTKKS